MIKVTDSSNISGFRYDEEKKELTIQFKGGGEYIYHDVPHHVYNDLGNAASLGTFVHKRLKGRFEHTKKEKKPK